MLFRIWARAFLSKPCSYQAEPVATLPTYSLVGIDALPVEVRQDGERAMVVEPGVGRTLRSVRLGTPWSTESVAALVVNVRTSPVRNLAPADLKNDG